MTEFAAPLVLTTPHITGQRVKDAQFLLSGHNRFPGLATYKDGTVDGDYGTLSAQATERAWFWIGAPPKQCIPVFTQDLYDYLRPGGKKLPAAWQRNREKRIADAAQTPGLKALELARTFVGTHEDPPGSNRTIFGEWYGWNGVFWCMIFVSYDFAHTGRPKFRYASCELAYWDAVYGRNNLYIVRTPQPGDVAIYRIGSDPYGHTAFVDAEVAQGQSFGDLGGNTGPSSVNNGGEVARAIRPWSMVHAFFRVK